MTQQYTDMHALLAADPQARQYFENLPDYVREQISTRANHVNSFEGLVGYADKLTRGDD